MTMTDPAFLLFVNAEVVQDVLGSFLPVAFIGFGLALVPWAVGALFSVLRRVFVSG